MVLQAKPQVDGTKSLPMNNTLMSSLPITVKLAYVQKVIRKVSFGESKNKAMGEEGARKLLLTPVGSL